MVSIRAVVSILLRVMAARIAVLQRRLRISKAASGHYQASQERRGCGPVESEAVRYNPDAREHALARQF